MTAVRRRDKTWLNRTVVGAGITSALGDVTYESTNAILPGFLAALGIPAVTLGAIEGTADALSSFTKLGAGYVADRLGHRKALVVTGYGLTTAMVAMFALAAGWPMLLAGRIVGWLGRGIRGPLRDAILVQAITDDTRGRAFGFHRAADSLGAIAGPLAGVALFSWAHDRYSGDLTPYRLVFVFMLLPGIASVASFASLVQDEQASPNPALRFWITIAGLPTRFRRYLVAVGVFGIGDFAHTLLILAATQLLTPRVGMAHAAATAGLLYVFRNTVQTVASFPIGAIADRVGHRPVLILGYALGTITALLMAMAFLEHVDSIAVLAAIFACAGLYVAVEDALEPTMAAAYVANEARSISYGVLGSVNGIGDFASSTVVGLLWTGISPVAGFGMAATTMAVGTAAMALLTTGD